MAGGSLVNLAIIGRYAAVLLKREKGTRIHTNNGRARSREGTRVQRRIPFLLSTPTSNLHYYSPPPKNLPTMPSLPPNRTRV